MPSLSYAFRLCRRALPPALALIAPPATYYTYRRHHRPDNETPRATGLPSSPDSTIATALPYLTPIGHAEAAPFSSVELRDHPAGSVKPGLPTISAAKVRASDGKTASSPILVTFRDGVYDIAEFVSSHPGGDQILLAAGGPLEPYWSLYPQHSDEFVLDLLEEYRVGNLQTDDLWTRTHRAAKDASKTNAKPSPYDTDPTRSSRLIVQSTAPYTAETPPDALVGAQHTPNELFYVRNHMPVPVIAAEDYRLHVTDRTGRRVATLTLNDLRTKFTPVTVSATVQCAGNRRNELNRVKKVKGGGWELGAISNAQWTGARLCDVLQYAIGETAAGDDVTEGTHGKHVCFAGLDKDPVTGTVYETSVPMDVLRRHKDSILAYQMNGETLPRDHGYPVRVVVPGVAGARHVKWLGNLTLQDDESTSHWQRQDYRSFAPDVDWNNVDFSSAPSIQEMPVVSAICTHVVDEKARTVRMQGYAWSGDGKEIIRVDVSADGGKSWTAAQLVEKDTGGRNEVYDWTLWRATVRLPDGKDDAQLVCKAVDSAYNTQPDDTASVWNLRGLLNNAWHRVKV